MNLIERVRAYVSRRRNSYRMVFNIDNPGAADVLSDLARFCRAAETTFLPDARGHAVLEGRREVWLRIQQHLRLTEQQLWDLAGAGEK